MISRVLNKIWWFFLLSILPALFILAAVATGEDEKNCGELSRKYSWENKRGSSFENVQKAKRALKECRKKNQIVIRLGGSS